MNICPDFSSWMGSVAPFTSCIDE